MSKTLTLALVLNLALLTEAFATVRTEVYYPFGEQGTRRSTTPLDASGHRRHMQVVNGMAASESTNVPTGIPSTQSLKFDGTGSYYALNPFPYAPPNNDAGFEGWVQVSDLTQTDSHIFGIGSGSEGFYCKFDASSGLTGFVSGIPMASPYLPITTNEWVHVAMVRDSGNTSFYVNGVFRSSSSIIPGLVHNWTVWLGDVNVFFKGFIDEFRIFTFTAGNFSTNDLLVNATAPVFASQPRASQIQEGTNVTAALGENVTFTITVFGAKAFGYWWYGAGNLAGGSASLSVSNLSLARSGDYYLVASNSFGSRTSEVVHLTVKEFRTLEPSFSPNAAQQGVMERKWGMFMHFGLDTFANTLKDSGEVLPPDVAVYRPVNLNPDQWVATAAAAGMKYVVLTAKHVVGFCLWDSAYTDYDVGNRNCSDNRDVIRLVKQACDKYGVKLGLYYCLWDAREPTYTADFYPGYLRYVTNQLTELLSNYGPICELWLDGANFRQKDPKDWHMPELYDHIKSLQPDCAVVMNSGTGGTNYMDDKSPTDYATGDSILYFPSDVRAADPNLPADPDPKLYKNQNRPDAYYYQPYESPQTIATAANYWYWWFYPPTGVDTQALISANTISNYYVLGTKATNAVLINVPPSANGIIESSYSNRIVEASALLGLPARTGSAVIVIQQINNTVVLSWNNAAFVLQSAPTVTGAFNDVPGNPHSPYTNVISAQTFFRLRH